MGNFIPFIIQKFKDKEVTLDLIDIDPNSIEVLKALLCKYDIPKNFKINFINDDFLLHHFEIGYDYIIGNPPFYKMKSNDKQLKIYKEHAINQASTNICSFFLDKAVKLGKYVAMVFPKFLLNTPEFSETRDYLSHKAIDCIIDFGEKGFPGVLIETIALFIHDRIPSKTKIIFYPKKETLIQDQAYIFDKKLPYWLIYRNATFDNTFNNLDFDVFTVFRDRQITKKDLQQHGEFRVLKSRNISDDGHSIIDIKGYDSYISNRIAPQFSVYTYLNADNVYLTPNMTYKPRMIKKPKGTIVNGSVAILIPKNNIAVSDKQIKYFSTDEYRAFYHIARNRQTRSLNVDSCSVYFYGLLKENT